MKILLIGASGGMGRPLKDALAADGHDVTVWGRETCDLSRPGSIAAACAELPALDAAIVVAGDFGEQSALETDAERRLRVLETNFRGTIEFCERVREPLLRDGGGILCVYTSVAAVRARASVALYGASKAGLDYYLDGIHQRYQDDGLHVLRVRPGFVKTRMTEGLKPPPFAAEPEATVAPVLAALRRRKNVVYTTPVWRYVMWVIRMLPRAILRRSGL